MSADDEIVITGVGVVSPIGNGHESFWQSLLEGKSGVSVRQEFADTDLPFRIGAAVKDFNPKQYVKPRKSLKIMCGPIQYGVAAAAMAVEHAQLDTDSVNSDRIGTVFGTETFFADPHEVAEVFLKCTVDRDYQHDRWGEYAMREIQPLWMLKYLPNMAASHISISLDARGPSNSICQGEASGLLALIEAADLIKRGVVDVVVAGGTGAQMAISAMLYRGTSMLSKRVNDPESASRPFSDQRDGMVVGEGAGALILESAKHAADRGARPLTKLSGWSRGFHDPSEEDFSDKLAGCFESALDHADFLPNDIGLVNANALGSTEQDLIESRAIRKIFADTPVVAHKSNFGNLGPGTSMVELVGSVLAKHHGVIPPSLNCPTVDPECGVNVQTVQAELAGSGILKSSFSPTGQVAAVLIS